MRDLSAAEFFFLGKSGLSSVVRSDLGLYAALWLWNTVPLTPVEDRPPGSNQSESRKARYLSGSLP